MWDFCGGYSFTCWLRKQGVRRAFPFLLLLCCINTHDCTKIDIHTHTSLYVLCIKNNLAYNILYKEYKLWHIDIAFSFLVMRLFMGLRNFYVQLNSLPFDSVGAISNSLLWIGGCSSFSGFAEDKSLFVFSLHFSYGNYLVLSIYTLAFENYCFSRLL